MKKRFLVAAEGLTKEAEGKMVEYFREKKLGWWHHVANFWLLTDASNTVTAEEIRDKIQSLRTAGSPILVMQVDKHRGWAGTFPNAKPDMFKWVRETWSKD
jgi:hypothetical protein